MINPSLSLCLAKIVKTKRAIKLIFKNNSFKEDESWKWKKDELRLFMATTKKSIMSSKKPYYVKVFDLHNRSMVNTFKFSSSYHGWKTLNISSKFRFYSVSIGILVGQEVGRNITSSDENTINIHDAVFRLADHEATSRQQRKIWTEDCRFP